MKFYILDITAAQTLVKTAASEDLEEAIQEAADRSVEEEDVDEFFESYTGLLDDQDIEVAGWAEHPFAVALTEISEGQFQWFAFTDAEAPELKKDLTKVAVTDEDIADYFGDDDPDTTDAIQATHKMLQQALAMIGKKQVGLLCVSL